MQPREPRRSLRGATLLEAMIVVTLLGIIAAIAVPSILPIVQRSRMRAAAEEVTGFVDDARRRAVSSGRCHRVVVSGGSVSMERRSTPDCVNLGLDTWAPVRSTTLSGGITVAVERLPNTVAVADAIVFRPNGRLRGDGDLNVTDDAARLRVNTPIPAATATISVAPTGRICSEVTQAPPPAIVAPLVCR